jgi:hypothetical protein
MSVFVPHGLIQRDDISSFPVIKKIKETTNRELLAHPKILPYIFPSQDYLQKALLSYVPAYRENGRTHFLESHALTVAGGPGEVSKTETSIQSAVNFGCLTCLATSDDPEMVRLNI